MKLSYCSVENFGSYKQLDFNFSSTGLCLISGPTGSGKSTICDIASWVLYGITAKNGNVDDIRSWTDSSSITKVVIQVITNNGTIVVTRTRGNGSSQNDLYWAEEGTEDVVRGKDICDTQKLLDERLGCSASLYLTSAYYHEFSDAASFFVTTAKTRRAVLENIAALDLPIKLMIAASAAKKSYKEELKLSDLKLSEINNRLKYLIEHRNKTQEISRQWKEKQVDLIVTLKNKFITFEEEKDKEIKELTKKAIKFENEERSPSHMIAAIEGLNSKIENFTLPNEDVCRTCGSINKAAQEQKEHLSSLKSEYRHLLKDLEKRKNCINPFFEQVDKAKKRQNTFEVQLQIEKNKENPFDGTISDVSEAIAQINSLIEKQKKEIALISHKLVSLDNIYDLSLMLRAELLKKSVAEVENTTNQYLNDFFDGEFRITLIVNDSDNLDVEITRNGHTCVYRQLSKGQRGLLKLCFVLSIMRVAANNSSIHFDNLFFDEALDGLDSELKVKAYSLFEKMSQEHENIMVIEHATELKELFSNQFQVSISSDISRIEEKDE